MNILVADDSVTMRRIFELTFAGEDAKLTCVDSGDAAIARASELTPDVVFVDSTMPTDGYRVASAIKTTPGLERTAVILLASQKSPYDEAKGKAAGVDDHVVKPFDTQQLIDKFKRVMAQPRTAAQRPAAGAQPAPRAPAAASAAASRGGTIAFERAPVMSAPQPKDVATVVPAAPPQRAAGRPAPAQPAAAAAAQPAMPAPAAAALASGSEMAKKLDRMGLTPEQVEGVLTLSREVIEKVVWEVVPDLAETLIREEIRRLTQ